MVTPCSDSARPMGAPSVVRRGAGLNLLLKLTAASGK